MEDLRPSSPSIDAITPHEIEPDVPWRWRRHEPEPYLRWRWPRHPLRLSIGRRHDPESPERIVEQREEDEDMEFEMDMENANRNVNRVMADFPQSRYPRSLIRDLLFNWPEEWVRFVLSQEDYSLPIELIELPTEQPTAASVRAGHATDSGDEEEMPDLEEMEEEEEQQDDSTKVIDVAQIGENHIVTREECMEKHGNEDRCGICLDNYSEGEEVKQSRRCKHEFHKDCIHTWLEQKGANGTCPACRKEF